MEYCSLAWPNKNGKKMNTALLQWPVSASPDPYCGSGNPIGSELTMSVTYVVHHLQRLSCRRNTQLKPLLLQFHRHNAFHLQNSAPNRLHPLWFRHSHRHRQWRLLFPHWVPSWTLILSQKIETFIFFGFSVFQISSWWGCWF